MFWKGKYYYEQLDWSFLSHYYKVERGGGAFHKA